MRRAVGGARLLVALAASVLACRSAQGSRPVDDDGPDLGCRGPTCQTLNGRQDGDPPPLIGGASLDIVDFQRCGLELAWRSGGDRGASFRASIYAWQHEVIPLPGGNVTTRCWGVRQTPSGASPPVANMRFDVDPSVPTLAAGDVFIPLKGEAILDGDLYATAHIEQNAPRDAREAFSIRIGVRSHRVHGAGFDGLHEGDAFAWGPYAARVVRIVSTANVSSGEYTQGWVDVAITPPAQAPAPGASPSQ
jgi:hypothetical protein